MGSVSPITTENEFRNESERDAANNCYDTNPLPPRRSYWQQPKAISEGSNSAKNEKRLREEAMNAATPGSINQAHYTHERERRCPQNRFQGRRCAKTDRENKPRYTPEKTGARPTAQKVALRTTRLGYFVRCHGQSGTACRTSLDGRTWHGAEATKDTAIAVRRLETNVARRTIVEVETRVGRHALLDAMPAVRTSDDRAQDRRGRPTAA